MPSAPELPVESADVLIVGAGMAGLTAANALQRAGRKVILLEKGRGVGGRVASRRIGAATFDHGAQFITARDPRFSGAMQQWQRIGIVEEWCRGFSGDRDGHPRWRGNPAMTSLPKHLAQDLQVVLDVEVRALRRSGGRWHAETGTGKTFAACAAVLTPPVPQALALLDAGQVVLEREIRAQLDNIAFERCVAVLAVLAGPSRMQPPGGTSPAHGPIAWIADNQLKGISAAGAITIHATPTWSLEHWDRDREETGLRLLEAANHWLGQKVETFQVHGWRYSKPVRVEERPCAVLSQSPLLVLAGDAFAGPRVEGAALSGWAAAERVLANSP